jgi:hypothetical protein
MCRYSFVFNAKAKTQVLQKDQRMQMKVAVHDAVTLVHQSNGDGLRGLIYIMGCRTFN